MGLEKGIYRLAEFKVATNLHFVKNSIFEVQ